jgi:hypothetical protein
VITVIFLGGELVHRERSLGMSQLDLHPEK